MADVVSREVRDKLFTRLVEEPAFREAVKKDWQAAFKEAGIDPHTVARGTLSRQEVQNFAGQRAGWEIVIIIFVRDLGQRVSINEAVNFEAR